MQIYELTSDPWAVRDLLLLADPSEEWVTEYLKQGVLLVAEEDGAFVGEILTIPVSDGWEIKNLAVLPSHWRRGIGRKLIEAAAARLPAKTKLIVGTADEPPAGKCVYQKCGFVYTHRIENFFTDNYPEPVFDHDVQCVHMAVLERKSERPNFFWMVYATVQRIPRGKVATYGQIALLCGNPRASRAVGYALHGNPMPGIIPCHRVVNREGRLAPGFAFGGPDEQRLLLEGEGVVLDTEGCVDLRRYAWYGD